LIEWLGSAITLNGVRYYFDPLKVIAVTAPSLHVNGKGSHGNNQ